MSVAVATNRGEDPSTDEERPLASALYRGWVSHLRTAPRPHRFRVPLHFLYLDLDELDTALGARWLASVERWNLLSFRRRDYFGDPDLPLAEAVRRRVSDEIGRAVDGPVRLLAHVRHFGFVFNPVTFAYCFAPDGETLEAVLAEITNTPWGERHSYVVDLRDAPVASETRRGETVIPRRHRSFPKAFHVSPFFDLDHTYDWGFSDPGEHLSVCMRNHREGERLFEARLELERRPLTGRSLAGAFLRNPVLPLFGLAAIYWQAARLWGKRTPFFPHPRKRAKEGAPTTEQTSSGSAPANRGVHP